MAVSLEDLPLPDELPAIPDGWRYESLGDLVEERGVSYGIVQPGSESSDGIPIVRVNNIRNGRIDTTDMLKVESTIESKFQRSRLRGGEVLLTLVGTLGEVAIVPENLRGWNVARAVGVIPVRKNPGSLWVSICLRSAFIQHCIRMWATTTVQATFNLRDLAKLPIPIPPTDTREAIASVLGTLDDKIELNRQMNATLEAMARALFQSWFVDFDPVRAKLDGRQPGFDKASLFPATFQDSEAGRIPNGWTVGKVGDLSTLNRDAVDPGNFPTETFDHFSLPAFDASRTPKVELGSAIMSNKLVVTPNSVLLSRLNPHIPRIWLPDLHPTRRSVCSTEFMVACSKPGVSREYLFSLFTNSTFASVYGTLVTGTTGSHQRIRSESVMEMQVAIPPPALIQAFTEMAKPMFDRINRNTEQSRTLATLRDTLLPKLLSGELTTGAIRNG
jgi:type I restriction enzyme S subunit